MVEEGLCCLRANVRSNNNKEVGGWRNCGCHREDLGTAGVAGAGIEGVSARGMRVVKRQQVVEEGLCCLRASGGSNNDKEVGGRRSCGGYGEGLGEGRSGWSGYRRSVSRRNACGGKTACG